MWVRGDGCKRGGCSGPKSAEYTREDTSWAEAARQREGDGKRRAHLQFSKETSLATIVESRVTDRAPPLRAVHRLKELSTACISAPSRAAAAPPLPMAAVRSRKEPAAAACMSLT